MIYPFVYSNSFILIIILNNYYPEEFLLKNTRLRAESYDKKHDIITVSDETAFYVCYTGKSDPNIDDMIRKANTTPKYIFGGRIHRGFYRYANKCNLRDMYKASKLKNKKLIFCGNRNGGATAIIASLIVFNLNEYRVDEVNNKNSVVLSVAYDSPGCVTKNVVKNCKYIDNIINFIYNKTFMSSSSRFYSVMEVVGITTALGVINPFLAIPAGLASLGYLSQTNYANIGRIFSIFEDNKNHEIGDYLIEIHKYLLFHPVDQSDTEVEIKRLIE